MCGSVFGGGSAPEPPPPPALPRQAAQRKAPQKVGIAATNVKEKQRALASRNRTVLTNPDGLAAVQANTGHKSLLGGN